MDSGKKRRGDKMIRRVNYKQDRGAKMHPMEKQPKLKTGDERKQSVARGLKATPHK